MDLAVKWRFFKSLYGGEDQDAERVYRWHIEERSGARMEAGIATDKWKTEIDDYVSSATGLFKSMSLHGFDSRYPVPIDPDGELLDGSHRVACALALEIPHIPVELRPNHVWAPAWGYLWFCEAKTSKHSKDVKRILDDWIALNDGNC
jgi:hypothetical protein